MDPRLTPVKSFESNAERVYELMDFDEKLLVHLREAAKGLVARQQPKGDRAVPPHWSAEPLLRIIEGVREHKSLQPYYLDMFNQCAVLLCSHFSAAIRQLYVESVGHAYRFLSSDQLLYETIEIPIWQLRSVEFEEMDNLVGEVMASRQGVSFQDMKSIARAFKDHLGYEPPRDELTDTIASLMACRHAIVHNGCIVDDRLVRQIEQLKSNRLSLTLSAGQKLQLTPEIIRLAGVSMLEYLRRTTDGVCLPPPAVSATAQQS